MINSWGHINSGDYINFDKDSLDSVSSIGDFFSTLNIHLVRTPTYSPELNGIENLFGFLKNEDYRGKARDMKMEVFLHREIPLVPQRNILEWTRNCVFHMNFH